MSAALIDLTRQCCDADEYLDMGYMCAKADACYNSLRPIGNSFWFGIPYTLNTSENIFFYLHVFLLAAVGVSVFFLLKKILPTCTFLLALLFLSWPTFFITLSDTPATLFFTEGLVLAIIGANRNSAIIFFAAGISLGLSALFRTAYFIPLLIAGTLFFIYSLAQILHSQRAAGLAIKWAPMLILGFIIPLSFQFYSTWKHTGQWNFLSESRSRGMISLHLNSDAAGYDTYLPQAGLFWSPNCAPQAGLLASLESADISSATCILKNRLAFYLGSYSPATYLGADTRNFFDNLYATKTSVAEKNEAGYFFESKSLLPLPPGTYRYNIVLSTSQHNTPLIANLRLDTWAISPATSAHSARPMIGNNHSQPVTITSATKSHTIDITHTSTAYLLSRITAADEFTIHATSLEPGGNPRRFNHALPQLKNTIGQDTALTKSNRFFSQAYLIINSVIAAFAFFYLFTQLAKTRSPVIIFIAALLFSVLVQCLIIIPEQRYIQGFLSACWLLCLLLLSGRPRQS